MFPELKEIQMLLATFDHNVNYVLQQAEETHKKDQLRIAELEKQIKELKKE